jgi:hypothetical protein
VGLPVVSAAAEVAVHFQHALRAAHQNEAPYRHWLLEQVLPQDLCAGVLTLPIVPPMIENWKGARDKHNEKRTFITPALRSQFPVFTALADAFQSPDVARLVADVCKIEVLGSFLRIEYTQDTNGVWLEPHCDIPEKLFSMIVYLCTGSDADGWGTDVYDTQRKWVSRSPGSFNSALLFVPGANTWHGLDRRRITGVRRLLQINYVNSAWRDRAQLAFPNQPITAS